ncbi:MAG: hypothetical protein ACREOU_05255 [Candidatus Eiseniibacteriota bacterium]
MVSRRNAPLAALFVGLIALAGCGTDNPISSGDPDLDAAAPSAPANLRAEARGNQTVLAWDANSEATVIGYEVHRYAPDPSRENAYQLVTSSPVTSTEFQISAGAGEGYYRVKAVSANSKKSALSAVTMATAESSPTQIEPSDNPGTTRR